MQAFRAGLLRTILGIFVTTIICASVAAPAAAGTATLSWDAPTTYEDGTPLSVISGYRIYYGTSSKNYTSSINAGNVTTYQLTNLPDGVTVYFAVTALDGANVESLASNEVSKSFPATAYNLSVTRAGTGTGTVTSLPAGISCGSICTASFATGSTVALTAAADVSSTFTGWSGACSGTGSCSVTMTAARSVTATFAIRTFTITSSAGSNGSISPSGAVSVNYGANRTFSLSPAQGYHVADVVVDGTSVGAVSSYAFTNVTANHSITASFAVNSYTVTPSAGANGSISPATPQTVNYNAATSFVVTPNKDYVLSSVTGCNGTLSGSTYTTGPVTSNCTVNATFAAIAANTLTVNRTGSGTVTSAPSGIDCGQVCTAVYTGGTAVTLSASPASGWSFSGWSGVCTGTGSCTVTMSASRTVTATFSDIQPPSLSVSTLPDGSVTGTKELNISGTATDNGGLQNLTINGAAVAVANNGTFSYLLVLASGQNTITTVARDLAGNTTTDKRVITLDQTAPGITLSAPVDNMATASSVMTVSGTVNETASVSVALNGGSPQLASMNGNAFTATVILRAGINTITVTATDAFGNASGSVKRTVTYDNGKPAVSITSPPNDVTTAQNSIVVQGQVTDSLTASTASIAVDGITAPLPLNGSGAFSATAQFSTEGQHAIVITATNQAGVSTTVQRNVQYTMFGDLNGSGSVDLVDAVLAFKHITGDRPITDSTERKRCDVAPLGTDGKPHPDGTINLGDVVVILRKVVGLVNW